MLPFIAPRYRILNLLGKGAMGEVYQAKDIQLKRIVAIKVLSSTIVSPSMCDRFEQEALISAQLGSRSLHIVCVHDFGINTENRPFYVMEYLPGTSLNQILNHQPLELPRFLNFARQICLGLQCAHQGIEMDLESNRLHPVIHQDIKPSNIMISPTPTIGELVKILDFGISRVGKALETGLYMGTMAYSSPEQLSVQPLDIRSDIYSLGVLLFEMLTGQLPVYAEAVASPISWYKAHRFQLPTPFSQIDIESQIPTLLETLIFSCLEKSPRDRPASIQDLLAILEFLIHRQEPNEIDSLNESSLLIDRQKHLDSRNTITPLTINTDADVASEEDVSLIWPANKPIQPIVFAKLDETDGKNIPAVWTMLPHRNIQTIQIHRLYNRIYHNFLFCLSPHPSLMWLTAIHIQNQQTYWFNCFLDLKTAGDQKMLYRLIEIRHYAMLMFDLEIPNCHSYQIDIELHSSQQSRLQQWLVLSNGYRYIHASALNESHRILKVEFERLKSQVEADLQRSL